MFEISKNSLADLITVLQQLPSQNSYTNTCKALSNATIGQHTRHIIELYQCLLNGYDKALVNYDDRKRNQLLENNIEDALIALQNIQKSLEKPNKPLDILYELNDEKITIQSNYFREVLYNLEHCIHHQALIKVALLSINALSISEEFGVAPSTIQYRKLHQ